jgi:hypothetical protein
MLMCHGMLYREGICNLLTKNDDKNKLLIYQ